MTQIDDILDESDFYFTVDYTEDIFLTVHFVNKAREMRKLNFVFGRSNEISLSSGFTFHGNLKFDK